MSVASAVLLGGRGRRLGGRTKALLPLEAADASAPSGARPAETLLERTLAVLDAVASPVLVSAAPGQTLPRAALEGRTVVVDGVEDQGPLAGLVAILEACPGERCLVVAGDMPRLSVSLLRALVALSLANPEHDVVVPVSARGPHPLHAVYARRLLPTARAHLAAGKLALRHLLAASRCLEVDAATLERYDPGLGSLENVNTDQDLVRVLGETAARAALAALPGRDA